MCARFLLSVVFCFSAATIHAQTSTDPADLQKQKDLLQLQIDVLNLQKTLAAAQAAPSAASTLTDQLTAQKAILDLKNSITTDQVNTAKTAIGTIDTSKLPSGTATLTSVDMQPTILGYEALENALGKVTLAKYCGAKSDKIVLGPGSLDDVTVLVAYQAIVKSLTDKLGKFKSGPDYAAAGRAAPQILPAAIFAGIDAVVALGSLFKTDVTMNGLSITPDAKAARFIMAKSLAACTVLDVNDFVGPTIQGSPFASSINTLDSAIDAATATESTIKNTDIPAFTKATTDAQAVVAKAKTLTDEIEATKKKLDDTKTTAVQKKTLNATLASDTKELAGLDPAKAAADIPLNDKKLAIANDAVSQIDLLVAAGTKLIAAIYKLDDAGTPFLTRLMKAEAIAAKTAGARTLTLSVAKLGGNNITRKNAFHTSIQFAGGVVVEYQLRDVDGLTVLDSGQYSGYTVQNEKAETVAEWPRKDKQE
jgi:hypothetical protein